MNNNNEYLFTFGFGHKNQGFCQPIFAPDEKTARERMVSMYGDKWSMVYTREFWESEKKRNGDLILFETELNPVISSTPIFVLKEFERMSDDEKRLFTSTMQTLQYVYGTENTDMDDRVHRWIVENPEEYVDFARSYRDTLF